MKTNLCRTPANQLLLSTPEASVLITCIHQLWRPMRYFFSFTKCMSFTQSILRLSAIAEDGKSHTKLGVACCAIGFKWRRNSIYRKVTAAMTPRMCMHVLGGLRADCRRHCRGHFWTPDLPPTCPRTCRGRDGGMSADMTASLPPD